MRGFFFFLILVTGFSPSALRALTLTDPLFQNLDVEAMETALKTATTPLDQGQIELFLFDALMQEEQIHAAHRHLQSLQSKCEAWEAEAFAKVAKGALRGRAASLCAIARTQSLAVAIPALQFFGAQILQDDLQIAKDNPIPPPEAMYVETRTYCFLPPAMGQKPLPSLLSGQSLKRLAPELISTDYWLGLCYLNQRNYEAARGAFAEALDRELPDLRAGELLERNELVNLKSYLDGHDYGWRPGIFYNPPQGVGLRLILFDDRLFDTDRSAKLHSYIASRWAYGVQARYVDRELIDEYLFYAQASVRQGIEEFFGIGNGSSNEDLAELVTERAELRVGIRRPFLRDFYFGLGWRLAQAQLQEYKDPRGVFQPTLVNEPFHSTYFGMTAELGWDTRDSRYYPTSGSLVSLAGFFPFHGGAPNQKFEKWNLDIEHYWLVAPRHTIYGKVVHAAATGPAPFAEYPRLLLSGVREGRLQDRNLLGLELGYEIRALWPYCFRGAVTLGQVESNWGALFAGDPRFGASLAVGVANNPTRTEMIWLDFGIFASEINLRVNMVRPF